MGREAPNSVTTERPGRRDFRSMAAGARTLHPELFSMNLYEATIPQFKRVLQNVERWLDKTVAFAASKKFDPNTLLSARLAPDQFSLVKQIQVVSDQPKLTVARLTGKEAPKHPDV